MAYRQTEDLDLAMTRDEIEAQREIARKAWSAGAGRPQSVEAVEPMRGGLNAYLDREFPLPALGEGRTLAGLVQHHAALTRSYRQSNTKLGEPIFILRE